MEHINVERYDRQIRLWGHHGQSRCSSSKICLVNANSLGTEILKGLCLAGIGSFTILDSLKLSPEDVGCNFIPQSCIGKSRGETVKQVLLDMNEDVNGEVQPLETYLPHVTQSHLCCDDLDQNTDFWKQFNCVIASGFLYIDQIVRLSTICWNLNLPLILCKSIGYYGSMRSQIRDHIVIETHPDNLLPDFYLDMPFKDLRQHFDSLDLESEKQSDDVGKQPYVIIIYKYLKRWQSKHGYSDTRLPSDYNEKKELKSMIDEGLKTFRKRRMKTSEDSNKSELNEGLPFENFLEANKAVNSCLVVSNKLPESVDAIFNHPHLKDSAPQHLSRFWIIIRAVKEFVLNRNGGLLPVSGTIPDMTSGSDQYIKLQTVYTNKARSDVDDVLSIVQSLINPSNSKPNGSLFDEVKLICKNIRELKIVNTAPIFEEYDFKNYMLEDQDEEDEFMTLGLCLKACDLFYSSYGRLPGNQNDQFEIDINKLKDSVKQMIGKAANKLKTLDQCLYELCRCGGAELHCTSAFLGGCIAQEVIKLITNQYVPINDTLVYNAMIASTKTFDFENTFSKV